MTARGNGAAETPAKIAVHVHPMAAPIVQFLRDHGHDLATFRADVLDPTAPPGRRFLMVHMVDRAAVDAMGAELRAAFALDETSWNLTNRVVLVPLPLDTFAVVFLDIAVVEA
jgi:hypothetical protein